MIHVLRDVSTISLIRTEHFKSLFKSLGNSELVWAVTQEWWGNLLIIHHHMYAQSCTETWFSVPFFDTSCEWRLVPPFFCWSLRSLQPLFRFLPFAATRINKSKSHPTVTRKVCQIPVCCLTNTRPLPRRGLFQYTTYKLLLTLQRHDEVLPLPASHLQLVRKQPRVSALSMSWGKMC